MAARAYSTDWTDKKATAAAVTRFEAQFAKELGFIPTRGRRLDKIQVIPTGSLELDEALVIGGWPRGRSSQVWGPEHSGKTTLANLAVANAQRLYPEKMVAWVDPEGTFDGDWAEALGVDLDRLWLVESPKTAERAADAFRRFVEQGLCSLTVLDSVGALTSRKEFEKLAEEDTVALVARIVSRLVGQVSSAGAETKTAMLLINQDRSSLAKYGPSSTPTGGRRIQFASTIRGKLGRASGEEPRTVKVEGQDAPLVVSFRAAFKVEKNKMAPSGGRVANFWLTNIPTEKHGPIGIDQVTEAVAAGLRHGLIHQGGGGIYEMPWGEKLKGREQVVATLRTRPDEVASIREQILAGLADQVQEQPSSPADDDPHGLSEVDD